MSRLTLLALLAALVLGAILGTHTSVDHIRTAMTKALTAQADTAKDQGKSLKCSPLAQLLPQIREQQIDAIVSGDKPVCGN